jgi:hypothetical protein
MLFFVWLGVYGKTKSLWIWDAPLSATNLCMKYLSDITLLLRYQHNLKTMSALFLCNVDALRSVLSYSGGTFDHKGML